jgi:SAM-dependent methyltransferase
MSVDDLVKEHYGAGDLAAIVLGALADHGVDLDRLTVDDLAPVDELHAGGLPAAQEVIRRLALATGQRLLDVGSGLGGPSRLAAASAGVTVTGVDLTPEFIDAARTLTERVGLTDRVTFEVGAGVGLPFDDASFDAAMMIHVGMNIQDKRSVFAEVHRVLQPGGAFVVFDQMRVSTGDLPYPLPWALDERSSFVESPDDYTQHLTAAGFTVDQTEDRTASVGPPPAESGTLSPAVVFGRQFMRRIRNNMQASDDGLLAAVLIVARA